MEYIIKKADARTGETKYQTACTARRHALIADEPEDKDGGDMGPTPSELLCMSLAACTSITLKMYAQRKQWNIGEVYVHVTMERFEDKSVFKKEIRFEHSPGEEEVKRLLLIADRCPVHKILQLPAEFQTILP